MAERTTIHHPSCPARLDLRSTCTQGCDGSQSDVQRLLLQLAAQVREAQLALEEEHEGNLTRAALLISVDAEALFKIVSSW
jgi:hypothetical protein